MKLIAILMLFPLIGGGGDGDEMKEDNRRRIPLSLRQSLFMALNNNLDIEVARFQPWIEQQSLLEQVGAFDYTVYASAGAGESVSPSASALSGAAKNENDTLNYSLGIRKTLPLGAFFDLGWTGDRLKTNSSFATLNPRWNQSLGISLTVPLLRNAGLDSVYSSVLIQRNTRDSSVDDFENTLSESIYAVEQAYWNLIFTIETFKVRQQGVEVAKRLVDDRTQLFKAGKIAKIDVTQAEAQAASQEEAVLTAENAMQDAMDKLKQLIDPALLRQLDVDLVPMDAPRSPVEALDEEVAIRNAMIAARENRPDWRKLLRDIESEGLLVNKYDRDTLPKIDLTARAALLGLEETFGESVDELFSGDFRDISAGITIEIPLGNSVAHGRLRAAELRKRRLDISLDNLEYQIMVEVREAVREIKTTEKRVGATREALRLAQEQFDGEWKRRAEGLRTTFHVLDAQEQLVEASSNEIKARIDYTLALQNLKRVTGTLLNTHEIRLQENLTPRLR